MIYFQNTNMFYEWYTNDKFQIIEILNVFVKSSFYIYCVLAK